MDLDNKIWLKRIIKKLISSDNERPPNVLLQSINGLENFLESKEKGKILIASDIPVTGDMKIDKEEIPFVNVMTGEDEDNPTHVLFEGEDWIQHGNTWRPPDVHDSPKIKKITKNEKSEPSAQSDSGANRIVTNEISLLQNIEYITPLPMGGCNANDEAAITCTARGILSLKSKEGQVIKTKAYYSDEVDGTIISPTTVV